MIQLYSLKWSERLTEHVYIDCEEDLSTILPYGFSNGRNDPVTAEQWYIAAKFKVYLYIDMITFTVVHRR